MREEDTGGREAGAASDLKMPLENGRADERVSRGQASERSVCVCKSVSVEKGARRPPLPAAVVCPPGGRRRRRLAVTADMTYYKAVCGECVFYYCRTYYKAVREWTHLPFRKSGQNDPPRFSTLDETHTPS